MNKNFTWKYKAKLMMVHMIVLILSIIGYAVLFFIADIMFNHTSLQMIQKYTDYAFALWFRTHKAEVMLLSLFLVLAVGWIIVELHWVGKVTTVITKMEVVFQKDDLQLELDKEFKEIQTELNLLKFENIRNEQLAQTEAQRKTDLITYLAHDIKTPLASVIGYLSLLEEVPDMPEAQREKYTKITLEKAYRLETLINEFFDITRFNLSTIPLEKEEINLKFMFIQMVEEFYPMLTPGKRRIELNVPEDLKIYADADKIARVFNNILKNAVAYSFENSAIIISAYSIEEKVFISFQNKGKVIPPHKLEAIFDKFFRLDSARSTNTGGAGLGLAIAKGIVTQHGGEIAAQSGEEGTVFTVELPNKVGKKTE